ncbi:hypothetical protein F4677DRAFT_445470 [Hypoxylon crocopeplum]|nr:hypothetical protein F4677DRAFT_445470 [Hypoxylon crocopeplum]
MLKKIFCLSAFALGVMAMNETIEGYNYFLSGPSVDRTKSQYEHDAAVVALGLLKKRLGNETLPALPDDNVQAVLKLKQSLGPDRLKELLQPDMDDADSHWHDLIGDSGDGWKAAKARGVIFLPNVTHELFAAWYSTEYADAANLAANPEHYFKHTNRTSTGLSSKILEDLDNNPFLEPLPDFPVQQAGDKDLRDGTRFGVLHIAVRPVNGADYNQPHDGFEIYSAVWYQDGALDSYLDKESQHMVIEIVNLTLQAQKDIASGKLAVTGSSGTI